MWDSPAPNRRGSLVGAQSGDNRAPSGQVLVAAYAACSSNLRAGAGGTRHGRVGGLTRTPGLAPGVISCCRIQGDMYIEAPEFHVGQSCTKP